MQQLTTLILNITPNEREIVRSILARFVTGREVWAFGSRVNGRAKRYSDLDLAIFGEEPLPLQTLVNLAEAFTESELPWKVDLVDWATTAPGFRRIIQAAHICL